MRIGTWNLEQASPRGHKGRRQRDVLEGLDVDVWLLTEAHQDVAVDDLGVVLSCPPIVGDERCRWAAVLARGVEPCASRHTGLALGRVPTRDGPLLAASSVLPWRSAGTSWPGDPSTSLLLRFEETITAHLDDVRAAHAAGPVVWGGDMNQALVGPERVGSAAGRDVLASAVAGLGLRCPTGDLASRLPGQCTIDHVAVPASWAVSAVRRVATDGSSDHDCYVVEVEPV